MSTNFNTLPEIKELKVRQRKFVLEYIVDGNGTRSAQKAGYAPKNACITASKLLTYPKIQNAIKACEELIAQENEVSVEWIAERIRKEAEEGKNASDRLRALELLGKYKGMFKENNTNIAVFSDEMANSILNRMNSAIGKPVTNERIKAIPDHRETIEVSTESV